METAEIVDGWLAALFERHRASLTFQEVRRGVQALSRSYVELRDRRRAPKALDGAGKRAAFACFFTPLHFLLVRELLVQLAPAAVERVVDLGCGCMGAGLAWATASTTAQTEVHGVDRNRWALDEAARNLSWFGRRGRAVLGDLCSFPSPAGATGVVVAFAANELDDDGRQRLLQRLLSGVAAGASVLVVEPIARSLTARWWPGWEAAFVGAGGRTDLWRLPVELPPRLRELDRAAGLDHRELTARTLYVARRSADAAVR
ncbi:MAG: class I SAM-dependent methyltransferase [Deltaproteobacteria bacterium]|nr:class I SAM-dependent methyltransferase [Deltaproteobacteria bacterium]